jgi:methionyl-tRNA synthetase
VTQPWILGRDEAQKDRLGTVLYVLAESIRFVAILISPVMPRTPELIFQQLGVTDSAQKEWASLAAFGALKPGSVVKKGDALFPRIDIKADLMALSQPDAGDEVPGEEPLVASKPTIPFDDFTKLDLRVARVVDCQAVPGSDKLLQFTLSLGDQTRTVVSGISAFYNPEQLIGRKLVLLCNLAPRKIRGVLSEGMLLSSEDPQDGTLRLLSADDDAAEGAEIG